MNFVTYLQTVQLRAKPYPELADHAKHGALGMFTEYGELADMLKRVVIYGKPLDATNLLEECGDFLWYLVLYCWANSIGMLVLEAIVENARKMIENNPAQLEQTEIYEAITAGMLPVATLASPFDITEMDQATRLALVESVLMLILLLLWKHGFTLEQCFIANDAKLEDRTGKKFDAAAILARDTAAERVVLEQHSGTNGSGQAAG